MTRIAALFKTLLPLLLLPLALVLVGASVVAPVCSLASSDIESRDFEDRETEIETIETIEASKDRRESAKRIVRGITTRLPGTTPPPNQGRRPAHPATDTWSAPRRL